jgi:hypothetical protein
MRFTTTGSTVLVPAIAMAFSCLLVTIVMAQTASVYRWVDENGITHFTDLPPESADVQNTGIRYQRTNPAAVQARLNQNQEAAQANRENLAEASERAAETREEKKISERERKERCQKAREQSTSYDTAHRLYRRTPDGGREYLSDDEIDKARSEADKSVSEWCS